LDSLQNRDLSIGYADKTTEEFSYHVPVMWRAARTGARGQGYAKAQDCPSGKLNLLSGFPEEIVVARAVSKSKSKGL
jgi:hypothetical protein